jgi:hypothetical protein
MDLEIKMKRNLFFVLIAITLVISTEACTAKTSSTISANALPGTTVSTTTSGKTLNNPPQVIEPVMTFPLLTPLKVASITSPVLPGDTVTVIVETMPNVSCNVDVGSGPVLNANGNRVEVLPSASAVNSIETSDANGRVTFTINVATDSDPGYCRVTITATDTNNETVKNNISGQYLPSKESTVLTSFLVY